MKKRRIRWLIAGMYLCIVLYNVIVCLENLKAELQIMRWLLFAMTVVLYIFIWKLESSLEVNSEEKVTEQVIEVQEDKAKKEIMTIYLSSGESFFHEIDSMKLSSQEIIDRWKNMPLDGELIVEDSEGWSAYKKDEIVAITILFEDIDYE